MAIIDWVTEAGRAPEAAGSGNITTSICNAGMKPNSEGLVPGWPLHPPHLQSTASRRSLDEPRFGDCERQKFIDVNHPDSVPEWLRGFPAKELQKCARVRITSLSNIFTLPYTSTSACSCCQSRNIFVGLCRQVVGHVFKGISAVQRRQSRALHLPTCQQKHGEIERWALQVARAGWDFAAAWRAARSPPATVLNAPHLSGWGGAPPPPRSCRSLCRSAGNEAG